MEAARRTVLVVEDDQDVRATVCDVLEDSGYAAIPASHGREAIERLRQQSVCLILLDLTMPVMDGWEFRAWQRSDPVAASIPVVLLSALRGLEAEASKLDPAGWLEKPVQLDELLDTVAAHCPG